MSDGLQQIFKKRTHPIQKIIIDGVFEISNFSDIEKMKSVKRRAKEAAKYHDEIVQQQAARIECLEKLVVAAAKFIDSHVAEPDITPEMWENYRQYTRLHVEVMGE